MKKPKSKLNDEYIWENYTQEYSAQLEEIKESDEQDFFISDFEINNGELIFKDNLHPNWKQLYYIAHKLNPQSIFECGCGAGYHLQNLHKIFPDKLISGCDLLQSQLDFAAEFSDLPEKIYSSLSELDFCDPLPSDMGKYEFVYSQAVVMHLSTRNAKLFLKNMGEVSSKYIFLVEGIKNHTNWAQLVKDTLPDFKEIPYDSKYIDYAILLEKR